MAVKVGSLVIKLAVDNALVKPGLDKAQHLNAKAAREIRSQWEDLGRKVSIAGAAIAGAVAGAVAGMAKLAFDSIQTADEISKAAQAIGMGTEELSRLRYAADISGVSFESLQGNLGRFNRGLFDAANGTGKTGEALARLGIDIRTADGQLKTQTQLLGELAARFQKMPDGVEKSALAMQIFGKSGADMIPFLNQGAEGIAKLTEEADRFGVVIDAETGRKAEAFNDNLTRLRGVLDAFATQIAAELLPVLVDFTDTSVASAGDVKRWAHAVGDAISDVKGLYRGLTDLVNVSANLGSTQSTFEATFRAIRHQISMTFPALTAFVNVLRSISSVGRTANYRDAIGLGEPGAQMKSVSAIIADSGIVMDRARASAQALNDEVSGGGGRRGRGGRAGRASAIAKIRDEAEQAARKLDELRSAFASVQNQLDPVLAAQRRRSEQQGIITDAARAGVGTQEERLRALGQTFEVFNALAIKVNDNITSIAKKTREQTAIIAENFAQMSDRVIVSLQGLAGSIQRGDFLGILGGLVNMFVQLGSTGLFGKSIAANINAPRIPGNANGTAYHPGGLMMVGERGPEILSVPRGGRVVPNHELRAASAEALAAHISVGVDPRTGNLTAFVNNRIAAAGPVIASAGAGLAQAELAQASKRKYR